MARRFHVVVNGRRPPPLGPISKLPQLAELAPYIQIESSDLYGQRRYELRAVPRALMRRALWFRCSCATCGRSITPVRERAGWGSGYLAVACGLDRVRCSRSAGARRESDALLRKLIELRGPSGHDDMPLFSMGARR